MAIRGSLPIAFFLFLGCQLAHAGEPHFLFLLFGGFQSHSDRNDQFMYDQVRDLTPADRTTYVLVSFSGDFHDPRVPEETFLEVIAPNRSGFSFERQVHPDELSRQIRQLVKYPADTYVALAGHSHGAWWAMKTVMDLPPGAKILQLATIDPISWLRCNNRSLPGMLSPFVRNRTAPQFDRAPSDLLPSYPRIASRVHPGTWLNYYQRQFLIMHSSRIESADVNFPPRSYPGGETIARMAHWQIAQDPSIWREIVRRLKISIRRIPSSSN